MKLDYLNSRQLTWASVAVAAVGVGTSVYKGIKSSEADKAAAKEGAALKRPFYQIPTEDIQNKNIFEENAGQGLSSGEKNYAQEQRERAFGSSAEALKEGGGGPNDFARLNSIFGDSLKSQSALDAQEHMQNIQMFTKANSDIAGQKSIQWGVNEKQPFESKLEEIQNRRIAAQTNENNALNEGLGSASAVATGINSYFKTNPGGKSAAVPPIASPYNRNFGLADTGGGTAGSPAAGFGSINPDSYNPGALIQPTDVSDNY